MGKQETSTCASEVSNAIPRVSRNLPQYENVYLIFSLSKFFPPERCLGGGLGKSRQPLLEYDTGISCDLHSGLPTTLTGNLVSFF